MVKINSYLISNAKQKLKYYDLDLDKNELMGVFKDAALIIEEEKDPEDFKDLPDVQNQMIPNQDFEFENLIDINNQLFLNNEQNNSDVEEEIEESEDEDTVDEKFNEFNEEEFGAEFAKNVMNDNNN
ncbi:hypothetical protein Glove_320g87 [Diversispora epigaea]|uniref:Uncharacterized protein n=1 Tax=Diversispora epigaea TaxID=1348612 RepID=A0A397HVX0_9GLOM|nr:hypothetical protein Glove_320g87 [Diversispora epigaea]